MVDSESVVDESVVNEPESNVVTEDVVSGRRQRKQVSHYTDKGSAVTKHFEAPTGSGTKIGDLPNVVERLSKFSGAGDELKAIHRVLFGTAGKKHEVKKHLYEFCGMAYVADENKAFGRERAFDSIGKWKMDLVKQVCDIFEVDRSGKKTKEELMDVLLDWLENPKSSGKKSLEKKRPMKKAVSKPSKRVKKTAQVVEDKEDTESEVPLVLLAKMEKSLKEIVANADRDTFSLKDAKKQLQKELGDSVAVHSKIIKDIVVGLLNE